MQKKKPLTFFGKKLKLDKTGRLYTGKSVKVSYNIRGPLNETGWEAQYDSRDMLEYTDSYNTPEGAVRVLENRLRRMRTTLNKLIPGSI